MQLSDTVCIMILPSFLGSKMFAIIPSSSISSNASASVIRDNKSSKLSTSRFKIGCDIFSYQTLKLYYCSDGCY